jgi:hypothetical protein
MKKSVVQIDYFAFTKLRVNESSAMTQLNSYNLVHYIVTVIHVYEIAQIQEGLNNETQLEILAIISGSDQNWSRFYCSHGDKCNFHQTVLAGENKCLMALNPFSVHEKESRNVLLRLRLGV